MNTENNIYFGHKDHKYYFGEDAFSSEPITDYDVIPIEKYVAQPLDDGGVAALMFVERDGKKGVITIDKAGQGGYGGVLYSSDKFPLLYDEMLLNGGFLGESLGYIAVRINHNWGILRVEGTGLSLAKRSKSGKKCIMIIPCMYRTKEEAIMHINKKDYHPEYGWRDPFSESPNED